MKYDDKYGVDCSDKKIQEDHLNRRMFCIKDGEVKLAPEKVEYSHAVWFDNEGWMSEDDTSFMDKVIRGYFTSDIICFYIGWDFHIDKNVEKEFFMHLKELVFKANIPENALIMGGGLPASNYDEVLKARKKYGLVGKILVVAENDKYGVDEDSEPVRSYHKNRRMFCIKDGSVCIAPKSAEYSHAVWFEKEGWMSEIGTNFMDATVRGYVDDTKIHFYTGWDFQINEQSEKIFFEHLGELIKKLKIPATHEICGGAVFTEGLLHFPVRKNYGIVGDLLAKS